MDRRTFLMSIGAALIPKVIRVNTSSISLYGIPYHENNASTGEWLGFPRFYGGARGGGKSHHLNVQEIVAIWNEKIPAIKSIFERDDKFYGEL